MNLSTTNLEIAVITSIRAKVEKEGKITIPSQTLTNYINFLEEESLVLELINSEIQIKSKKSQAKIKCISAEEFPIIPSVPQKEKVVFKAEVLKNALNKTSSLVSPLETRIEISGVLFKSDPENKKRFILVGTDSYRLAEKSIFTEENTNKSDFHLIIPVKTVQELIRIINEKGAVEVYPAENQILFVYQETKIVSRLIAGQFPDYQQIVPSVFKTRIRVEKDSFLKSIKAVSLFSRTGINDVFLKTNKDSILVSSVDNQLGESNIAVAAEIEGDENEITFNYHYLIDGLNNLSGNETVLEINSDLTPAVLRSEEEPDYFYLVMPIKQ